MLAQSSVGERETAEGHQTAKCSGQELRQRAGIALVCTGLVVAIVLGVLAATGNLSPGTTGGGAMKASGNSEEVEGGADTTDTTDKRQASRTCTDTSKACTLAEYAKGPFGDLLL